MGVLESKEKWTNQSLLELFRKDFYFFKQKEHAMFGNCEIYKSYKEPNNLILRYSKLSTEENFLEFFENAQNCKNFFHPNLIHCYGTLSESSSTFCSTLSCFSVFYEYYEENLADIFMIKTGKDEFFSEEELINFYNDLLKILQILQMNNWHIYETLNLESFYVAKEKRLKLLPNVFFKKNAKINQNNSLKERIKEIILGLSCLNFYFSEREKIEIIKKKYSFEFLQMISSEISEEIFAISHDEKEKEIKKTPKKKINHDLVSFQDDSYFMSPIKNEAKINNPYI